MRTSPETQLFLHQFYTLIIIIQRKVHRVSMENHSFSESQAKMGHSQAKISQKNSMKIQ